MLFGTTAVAIEYIRAGKVAEGLKWVGFAGSRTLLDHAGLVLPVALQRLRFCRRPVTPLFLRCFFQRGPPTRTEFDSETRLSAQSGPKRRKGAAA
jgi:hypothetical protein